MNQSERSRICHSSAFPRHKVGEQIFSWALQAGDASTRIALPNWMASFLELRISRFVSDWESWQKTINKRQEQNKALTKKQQQGYDRFVADQVQKLVFNKVKKCHVADASIVKRSLKDCIAFTLHLSEDPAALQIEAGNHEIFRLVLLKSSALDRATPLPDILDVPPQLGDCPRPALEEAEEDLDAEAEDDAGFLSEAEVLAMEDEKHRAEHHGAGEEQEEPEIQLLADSDDDPVDYGLPSIYIHKVKNFMNRPAWKELDAKGLCEIPRHVKGCSMAYHSTTQQWQGYYPNATNVLSAIWGGASKRSEMEALLRALKGVVQAHVFACPRESLWQKQLEKLQRAEATL